MKFSLSGRPMAVVLASNITRPSPRASVGVKPLYEVVKNGDMRSCRHRNDSNMSLVTIKHILIGTGFDDFE